MRVLLMSHPGVSAGGRDEVRHEFATRLLLNRVLTVPEDMNAHRGSSIRSPGALPQSYATVRNGFRAVAAAALLDPLHPTQRQVRRRSALALLVAEDGRQLETGIRKGRWDGTTAGDEEQEKVAHPSTMTTPNSYSN